MPSRIDIVNRNYYIIESLEALIKQNFPDAQVQVSYGMNKLEAEEGEVVTVVLSDTEVDQIKVASSVKGTGFRFGLFFLLFLPLLVVFRMEVVEAHLGIELASYALALAIAIFPGRRKGNKWEEERERLENKYTELFTQFNVVVEEEEEEE